MTHFPHRDPGLTACGLDVEDCPEVVTDLAAVDCLECIARIPCDGCDGPLFFGDHRRCGRVG